MILGSQSREHAVTSVEPDNLTATSAPARSDAARMRSVVDGLLVFAVLFAHAAWTVPEINEAHYVLKAKHFWEPQSLDRDLFLSSRNSHVAFFAVFGWLPHLMSLEAAAWCGRVAAWLLVAWGWRRLSWAVAPRLGLAALSAAAALALNRYGHMAGEWYVGGIEAKSIAYGFVFAGLADVLLARWNRGLILLGTATAFHVLVGGWALVAVGMVWLLEAGRRPPLRSLALGLAIAAPLSAAGVIPGLLLNRGTAPEIVAEAERIYVRLRIAHHLDPEYLVPRLGWHLAAVYGAWLLLYIAIPADDRRRRLRHFAAGAFFILVGGLVIGSCLPAEMTLRASLLKFYWFRLADVAGPIALALETAALAAAAPTYTASSSHISSTTAPGSSVRLRLVSAVAALVLVGAGGWHLGETTYVRAHTAMARGENLFDASNLGSWRDACNWIRTNTRPDALVLAPRSFHTFKWYADRAEFANWKDVPQDARSLVEWKRRLDRLYPEGSSHWVNFLPADLLREVCREYRVDYVVAYVEPPLELPMIYRNNEFAVYEVPRDGSAANLPQ
jgi:hypothetical protein